MKDIKERPLVSISVPVYNAEKCLRQCLDSLINQTLKNIEIVVVNDGSTDSCESIIREYAECDPRVILVNKENGGSASARQAALDNSSGIYIGSCDADDWVEPDMYEKLYKKAVETDADIVMCDYWSEYPDGKQMVSHYELDPSIREDLLDDALNGKLPCMVWNKIFKRDLFEQYSISWEPGINLGEDFLLMMKMLRCGVTVRNVNAQLYHYRREFGGTSYTNSITLNTFRQSLFLRNWAMENIDSDKYANGVFRLWLSLAFTALRLKDGLDSEFYKRGVLNHLHLKDFFKYKYPVLKGAIVILAKILGYRCAKFIYIHTYKYVYI